MTSFSTRENNNNNKKGKIRQKKSTRTRTPPFEPPGMSTLHAKMRNKFAVTEKKKMLNLIGLAT